MIYSRLHQSGGKLNSMIVKNTVVVVKISNAVITLFFMKNALNIKH